MTRQTVDYIPGSNSEVFHANEPINQWVKFQRGGGDFYAQIYERINASGYPVLIVLHGAIIGGRRVVVKVVFESNDRRDAHRYLARNGFLPYE